ncbi:MAG: tRNA (guanine(37)-N(1))-methyltransferase [Candidatus Saccharibacteria bacterium]|nr:tRNA (guanine(37)-N(1))-methyltransferase [Candidatus Saccharibacteria bacterium]
MSRFTFITLFREAIEPYLNTSMMLKAQKIGAAEFDFVDLREFGIGKHKSVDDTPYGGGDGMLLRCEPVFSAVESVLTEGAKVIMPTPAGEKWTQKRAQALAGISHTEISAKNLRESITKESELEKKPNEPNRHFIIICPHYEGYDERIMSMVNYPISVGNYVLTGGEIPALIIVDSIVRLLPGVLGGDSSAAIESFSDEKGEMIEFPQWTKPAEFRGMKVPEILLSGNHEKIARWRMEQMRKNMD